MRWGAGPLRVLGRRCAAAGAAALLLAGCASMPDSGEVRKVDNGQQADADSQVRVFAHPAAPGESAAEIVSGFLEAMTSDEPDFATARKYLTTRVSKPLESVGQDHRAVRRPADADDGTALGPKAGSAPWSALSGDQDRARWTPSTPTSRRRRAPFHALRPSGAGRATRVADRRAAARPGAGRRRTSSGYYHSVEHVLLRRAGPDGQRAGPGSRRWSPTRSICAADRPTR